MPVLRLRRGEKTLALLDPKVADDFHLGAGDPIKLVCGDYIVAGIVREMPGESSLMLSLRGRVYVPWRRAVPDIAAGKPPNRGNYRLFLRLPKPANLTAAASEIKSHIADAFSILMTADEMGKNIDQALVHGNQFFSLVVFAALFLGAIGVASALHVYIREKIGTVAILRCLGASAPQAMGIYLCQAAALGRVPEQPGAPSSRIATQFALPRLLPGCSSDASGSPFFAWQPVLAGMGAGFFIVVLSWPCCRCWRSGGFLRWRRFVPIPAPALAGIRRRIAVWFLIAAAVGGFAYWQTGNWRPALAYTAALAISFGVFAAAAAAVADVHARRASSSRGMRLSSSGRASPIFTVRATARHCCSWRWG